MNSLEKGSWRHYFFKQLIVGGWPEKGISPLNKFIIKLILVSIFIFILETEDTIYYQFQTFFNYINFLFAIIFSIEYLARLYLIGFHYDYKGFWGRVRYFFSWHSIVDLLAIIPLYISGITHDSFLLRILRYYVYWFLQSLVGTLRQ